ncbi:MAG: HD domain-containing phosphohydrolase, partial [Nitrospirota bacterium]|nr:HD domain-containing phosphohydrolase [Nitrospirota bacterium]
MSYQPARREDLRIGLAIKIAGSWFNHPFSKNTFKIMTPEDLATLCSLRNIKILYDPAESDPLPSSEIEDDRIEDETAPVEPPPTPTVDNPLNHLSTAPQREARQQAFAARREKLKEAERVYQEVLKQNKTSLREIRAGYAMGVSKAEDLVTNLGDILQTGSLVCLMNLMGSDEIGDEFQCHSLNVAMLSMVIGQGLDLPQDLMKMIGMGALFHDIGELEWAGMFIKKGAKMNKQEQQFLRQHPHHGRKMLERGFGFSEASLTVISQHHERLNGTGFPDGLQGEAIHLNARIVMIADTYDELCNNPQREKSLTPHEVLSTIYAKRQEEFWEEAVVAFIQALGIYPPSSLVELSDGSIGLVSTI